MFVVNRSNKGDGIPAECFECRQPYLWIKVGKGLKAASQGGKGKGAPKGPRGQKEAEGSGQFKAQMAKLEKANKDLNRENRELKQTYAQGAPSPDEKDQPGQGDEPDELAKEIKSLQGAVEFMEANRVMVEELPKYKAKLEAAKAKKAAAKPIGIQLREAEKKALQARKAVEGIGRTLTKLKEESQELAAKVKETESKAKEQADTAALREAEYQSLLQKRCEPIAPQAMALYHEEVSLFKVLFKLVSQQDLQTKCEQAGVEFEGLEAKTLAAVAKLEAMAVTPAAAAEASGCEINAANFEKLQKQLAQVREQVDKMEEDHLMDSDEESVVQSESGSASPPGRGKKRQKTRKLKESVGALRALTIKF